MLIKYTLQLFVLLPFSVFFLLLIKKKQLAAKWKDKEQNYTNQ